MNVAGWIDRARSFLTVDLWSMDFERSSRLSIIRPLQFAIMVGEGFVRDQLLLRSSALTYFTVLSVIPVLAVAVALVGSLGVGSDQFVDFAVANLAAGSVQAQETIRKLVEGADLTGLGSLSAAVLFITTVLAIRNVEATFNYIWGVAEGRSLARSFPDYLAVIVVGPLLGGIALSTAGSLRNEWIVEQLSALPLFETLLQVGLKQLPMLALGVALSFLYWFLPNTRVSPVSALIGGVPAGILTVVAQQAYLDFSIGAARASTFFGGFAALPLLFVWIYVFWAIVLFGAEIAFAHQNLHLYRREVRGQPAGPAEREAIGLRIALEVARRFRDGAPMLDASALAEALEVPVRTMRDVAGRLLDAGVLAPRGEESGREAGFQLGRPAERISITDVLGALRGEREQLAGDPELSASVESVLGVIEAKAYAEAGQRTLAELVEGLAPSRVAAS